MLEGRPISSMIYAEPPQATLYYHNMVTTVAGDQGFSSNAFGFEGHGCP